MQQTAREFVVVTRGRGLYEFTGEVAAWVASFPIITGLLTLHIRHTSASLIIQENADPDVVADLETFFSELVPESMPWVLHSAEGPDDMPAHIRAALTQSQVSIPIIGGELALGTWQGIFVFEHRHHRHRRKVAAHLLGGWKSD